MWPKPQFSWYVTAQKKETTDLVTFTEEILNGKLHFLCSEIYGTWTSYFCPSLSLIQFSHGTFWNVRTTFFIFVVLSFFSLILTKDSSILSCVSKSIFPYQPPFQTSIILIPVQLFSTFYPSSPLFRFLELVGNLEYLN